MESTKQPEKTFVDIELDKAFKAAKKSLGLERVKELLQKTSDEWKEVIVYNTLEIGRLKKELEANPSYVKLKADLKLLNSAANETKKPLSDTINLALLVKNYDPSAIDTMVGKLGEKIEIIKKSQLTTDDASEAVLTLQDGLESSNLTVLNT